MEPIKASLYSPVKHYLLTGRDSKVDHQLMLESSSENEALAARIRRVIADLPFSKSELADRLGVTPQAVTGWEATGRIGKKSLAGLANLAGLSVNYLLTGAEAQEAPQWVSVLGALPQDLLMIEASDEAMAPRVHAGDTVLYDPNDTTPVDDRLFVVSLGNASKLLVRRCRDFGEFFFDALNPVDPAWPRPRKQHDEGQPIVVHGRVKWVGGWERP